jgi:hypothetical protein
VIESLSADCESRTRQEAFVNSRERFVATQRLNLNGSGLLGKPALVYVPGPRPPATVCRAPVIKD